MRNKSKVIIILLKIIATISVIISLKNSQLIHQLIHGGWSSGQYKFLQDYLSHFEIITIKIDTPNLYIQFYVPNMMKIIWVHELID